MLTYANPPLTLLTIAKFANIENLTMDAMWLDTKFDNTNPQLCTTKVTQTILTKMFNLCWQWTQPLTYVDIWTHNLFDTTDVTLTHVWHNRCYPNPCLTQPMLHNPCLTQPMLPYVWHNRCYPNPCFTQPLTQLVTLTHVWHNRCYPNPCLTQHMLP